MIRKTGVWTGGCVTPYLAVPAAEEPSLKQTKKQNTKTRSPQMGFPVMTCSYPGDFQDVKDLKAFGFISGLSEPKALGRGRGIAACKSLTETEACPPPHSQGHPMTCGKEEGQKG